MFSRSLISSLNYSSNNHLLTVSAAGVWSAKTHEVQVSSTGSPRDTDRGSKRAQSMERPTGRVAEEKAPKRRWYILSCHLEERVWPERRWWQQCFQGRVACSHDAEPLYWLVGSCRYVSRPSVNPSMRWPLTASTPLQGVTFCDCYSFVSEI